MVKIRKASVILLSISCLILALLIIIEFGIPFLLQVKHSVAFFGRTPQLVHFVEGNGWYIQSESCMTKQDVINTYVPIKDLIKEGQMINIIGTPFQIYYSTIKRGNKFPTDIFLYNGNCYIHYQPEDDSP